MVSLEEFFEANDVRYSMGANLSHDEHPGIQAFYRLLHSIRDRPDVQGVFVELRHYDGADEWPYSDTVFIVTSAPRDAIESSLAELHPTEILEGWGVRPEIKTPLLESQLRPGMHVWCHGGIENESPALQYGPSRWQAINFNHQRTRFRRPSAHREAPAPANT